MEFKDCIEKLNDNELKQYDKDYMKIKFNSDFPTKTVIIRNILEKDGKYYPQIFLDQCLFEV